MLGMNGSGEKSDPKFSAVSWPTTSTRDLGLHRKKYSGTQLHEHTVSFYGIYTQTCCEVAVVK